MRPFRSFRRLWVPPESGHPPGHPERSFEGTDYPNGCRQKRSFALVCSERILRNLNQPATTPKHTHPAKNAVVSFGGPHYVGRITVHEGETDG